MLNCGRYEPDDHIRKARAIFLGGIVCGELHYRGYGTNECLKIAFGHAGLRQGLACGCQRQPNSILSGAPKPGRLTVRVPRSEEHTSELQSLMRISYAVFCLKKKKTTKNHSPT